MKKILSNYYLYYWLYIAVARALPTYLIVTKYNLFSSETSTAYSIGFVGVLLILWLAIKFWSDLKEFALDMPEGFTREFALSVANVVPYGLLYGIGLVSSQLTDEFMFFAGTLLWTNALGVFLKANHMRLKRLALKGRGYVNVLR